MGKRMPRKVNNRNMLRGHIVRIINDVRLGFGDGKGTLGEVADRILHWVDELPMQLPEPRVVWVVYDYCDCEDPGCYGKADLKVFTSEQTALQEADLRTRRYGGMQSPNQHIDKITVSTKIGGF